MKFNYENKIEYKNLYENLDDLNIGSAQKCSIVLVREGLKPASEIEIYKWNDDVNKVTEILDNLNLCYFIESTPGDNPTTIGIAQNKEILTNLKSLIESRNTVIDNKGELSNEFHDQYGKLMGFPNSAIQAFKTKEFIEDDLIPEDIKYLSPVFRISKNNSENEIKILRSWREVLELNIPKSFKESQPFGFQE